MVMTSLTRTPWHALHGVFTLGDANSFCPACPDKHPAAVLPALLAYCVPPTVVRWEEKSHPGLRNFPWGEKSAGPNPSLACADTDTQGHIQTLASSHGSTLPEKPSPKEVCTLPGQATVLTNLCFPAP